MSEPRTKLQNSSLHGTLDAYAQKLNAAGYDYITFAEEAKQKGFAVNWTKENLKHFFDGITLAMYEKTSSKLTTTQIQEAYMVFEREIAKRSGVAHEWHSRESLAGKRGWW